jgi:hypothetical protein
MLLRAALIREESPDVYEKLLQLESNRDAKVE